MSMSEDFGPLDTFPKLLLHQARERGGRPAIREKDLGIWQTWTWHDLAEEVCALDCGLAAQGLRRGDHIALVGDNRPRLYAAMSAAQCLGSIPVPLYQDAVAAEMAFPIQNALISHAVVEDQEQVDKLLEILPQCPTLTRIFFDDPRGLRHYAREGLASYDSLLAAGRESFRRDPASLTAETAKGRGGDPAARFFTSVTGYCICCPEAADTVTTDMREIGPSYYFAPPRVLEAVLTQVSIRMEDASRLKRWLYRRFMDVAERVGGALLDGTPVSAADRL